MRKTTILGSQAAGVALWALVSVMAPASPGLASDYETIDVPDGGTIAGTVRVSKPPKPLPPLEVFKNKAACGATVPNDALVIGEDGAVRYAVVHLQGIARGRAPEAEALNVIDNRNCRFVPHVVTASVGQWLVFKNSDPVLHNADARIGTKPLFNVAITPGREVRRPLVEPGLVKINCDVRHTWMEAYVFVAVHPYHTVTDASGEYEIRDIPPGRYTVRVWHERLGEQQKEVEVHAGKMAPLNFDLSE
jgi:plastocyanin